MLHAKTVGSRERVGNFPNTVVNILCSLEHFWEIVYLFVMEELHLKYIFSRLNFNQVDHCPEENQKIFFWLFELRHTVF